MPSKFHKVYPNSSSNGESKGRRLTLRKNHKFDQVDLPVEKQLSPDQLKHLHDCIHFSKGFLGNELKKRMDKCLEIG